MLHKLLAKSAFEISSIYQINLKRFQLFPPLLFKTLNKQIQEN